MTKGITNTAGAAAPVLQLDSVAQMPADLSILASIGSDRRFDIGQALRWAAAARKISMARLAFDIMRRQIGRQKLTTADYFHFGLHLERFTNTSRAKFLGNAATLKLNKSLSDPGVVQVWRNKVSTAVALEQAGLPTPPIRAVFQLTGERRPYHHLDTLQALTDYLAKEAALPFFGKPVDGAEGKGAASIVARYGHERVVLGDGRVVKVAALAQEIAHRYPQGYIFQDKLRQHPDLVALAGEVMCSLRVMSIWVGGTFVPMYSVMRLPAPGAMLDISWNSTASIDMTTGRITRTQDGRRLGGHGLEKSHVTGAALIGVQLPFWPQVMALTAKAHALFPQQGVLGIDIALTEDGPMIVELNSNPGHGGYHQTHDEGILNTAFRDVFAAALAERGITGRRARMVLP